MNVFLKTAFILSLVFLFNLILINSAKATQASNKLNGRILLQVEDKGQAYYVYPKTGERAYLGRPDDAFRVMRELGIGISEKTYNSFNGVAPKRLSGMILLRVEANGEAYYVNPKDLKLYYLGRPDDAFDVMRNQGMGITNSDLEKISVFEKYKEQTDKNSANIDELNKKLNEQNKKIEELELKVRKNNSDIYSDNPMSTSTPTSTVAIKCDKDVWSCSDWGICSTDGVRYRNCKKIKECEFDKSNSPATNESCVYSKLICSSYTYSDWGECQSSGAQFRSIISFYPDGCEGGNPVISQSCSMVGNCTSWVYSDWSACVNNTQTRHVLQSIPEKCVGGEPVLQKECSSDLISYKKSFQNNNTEIIINFNVKSPNLVVKYIPTTTSIEPHGNVSVLACNKSKTLPGYGSNLIYGDDGYVEPGHKALPTKYFNFNLESGWNLNDCKDYRIVVSDIYTTIETQISEWVIWDTSNNVRINLK